MTDNRVTQQSVQVVADPSASARVSQQAIQVVSDVSAFARITQQAIGVVSNRHPSGRISQQSVMAVAKNYQPRSGLQKPQVVTTAKSSPIPVAGDDYFEKVDLLLRSDRGLVDCSKNRRIVSGDRIQGPFVQATNPKFAACFRQVIPNVASEWTRGCALAPGQQWDLKGRRFTIEGFYRREANMGSGAGMLGVHDWLTPANSSWGIVCNGLAGLEFWFWDNEGTKHVLQTPTNGVLLLNTWHHVCVERDIDGIIRLYLDGVMAASMTFTGKIKDSSVPLQVGAAGTASTYRWRGAFDDIRITRGIARYASNGGFTVPDQHYPFRNFADPRPTEDPYWNLVSFLLDPSTAGMVDESPRATTITRASGGAFERVNFGNVWGANANGYNVANTVHTAQNVDSQFNLGEDGKPFTVELVLAYNATQGIVNFEQHKFVGVLTEWASSGSYNWRRYNGSSYVTLGMTSLPHGYQENDWIVLSYDEHKTVRYYANGCIYGKVFNVDFPSNPNNVFEMGGTGGGPRLHDVRVTKGIARYKDDFCIPGYESCTKPFKFGATYVPPETEDATLPYKLPQVDNRAMTFPSVEQWINYAGGIPGRYDEHTQRAGRTGMPDDFFMFHLQATTRVATGQTYSVPPEFFDQMDAGELKAVLTMKFGITVNLTAQTEANYGIRALDANGVPIYTRMAANQKGQAWNDKTLTAFLPPNTRQLQLFLTSYNPEAYPTTFFHGFDIVISEVDDPVWHVTAPTYPVDTAQWNVIEGTTKTTQAVDYGMTGFATSGFQGDYYYVTDLPAALDADIDAGEVAFTMRWIVSAHSGDIGDSGRCYIEFTDDADAVVGVRQYERPDWAYPPLGVGGFSMSRKIPAGARKVRMGYRAQVSMQEGPTGFQSFYPVAFGGYCTKPVSFTPDDPIPAAGSDDPYWRHVAMLLSSRNGNVENLAPVPNVTWTITGTVQHTTSHSKFGDAHAIEINPAVQVNASHYITAQPYINALNTKFTFEGWFRLDSTTSRNNMGVSNQMGTAMGFTNSYGLSGAPNLSPEGTPPYFEWFHFAVCRYDDGTMKIFFNGKKQLEEIGPGQRAETYFTQWAAAFELFRQGTSSSYNSWNGKADEVRLTDGVARYTTDFVPQSDRYHVTDGYDYNDGRLEAMFLGGAGSGTNSNTYTFASFPIGPAHADRRVVVAVQRTCTQANNADPTTVTIGGVAATKLGSMLHNFDGTWGFNVTWWVANVPTGTTASVVATWPAAGYRAAIMGFRINKAFTLVEHVKGSTGDANFESSGLVDTKAGGLLLANCLFGGGGISGNHMSVAFDHIRADETDREIKVKRRDWWTGIVGKGFWTIEGDSSANHNTLSLLSLQP